MTPQEFNAMLIGLFAGLLVGLVPLITGMKKNQPALAVGGFLTCSITGAILGLVLAIPAACLFWWLIKKAPNKSGDYKD